MANKYYFFTDSDLVSQSNGQEFGAISSSQFRVNSMHSGANAAAYAVCEGTILVQEVSASTVNLILKPTVQPEQGVGYINYIVYKGISKASLINGSEIAAETNNKLTQHIWDTQRAINASIDEAEGNSPNTTQTNPPSSAVGINFSAGASGTNLIPDTEFLDKFFFTEGIYAPMKVTGGWHIGGFEATFGLEIITQKLGHKATFGDIRVLDHLIDVPTGSTQAEQFVAKNKREEVLAYLDVAAFYGSFFNYKIHVKQSSETEFTEMDGAQFYTAFLDSFINKNTVYLDIRNDYGYSFNFFEDYQDQIKVNGSTVDYYTSGWPVYASMNTTSIDLQLPIGENNGPLGYIPDSNFAPAGSHRFNWMRSTTANYYDLGIPLPISQSGGSAVANYLQVKYIKLIDQDSIASQSIGTVLRAALPYDHAFIPLEMTYVFSDSEKSQGFLWFDNQYMDTFIVNQQSANCILGVSRETNGDYTFFSYAYQKLVTSIADHIDSISFASGKTEQNTYLKDLMKKSNLFFDFVEVEINGSTESVPIVRSINSDNPIVQKNSTDVFVFSITASEYSTLEGLQTSQFHSDFKSFLSFKPINGGTTDTGLNYLEVELELSGFQESNNQISVSSVNSGITKFLIL